MDLIVTSAEDHTKVWMEQVDRGGLFNHTNLACLLLLGMYVLSR